jgi:ABC-type polysaccharide/polyol phosphate transport system ATPase subunit
MKVQLTISSAIRTNPQILLLDVVFAVGEIEFLFILPCTNRVPHVFQQAPYEN